MTEPQQTARRRSPSPRAPHRIPVYPREGAAQSVRGRPPPTSGPGSVAGKYGPGDSYGGGDYRRRSPPRDRGGMGYRPNYGGPFPGRRPSPPRRRPSPPRRRYPQPYNHTCLARSISCEHHTTYFQQNKQLFHSNQS